MSFKNVLGHARPIEFLQRAMKTDMVAHSYLFLGSEGIGKKWVALQFAKALNCLKGGADAWDACDACPSCNKIDHGLHPDILILEPENQTIKVDQVRQMQRDLIYQPYEAQRRVCILTAADRMAPNMSNILLKTLEEPPIHTILILLANNAKLILPTILSRCQVIHFNPLPTALVTQWLLERGGVSEAEAHLAASLSEGSPGRALILQEEIQLIPRSEFLKGWVGSSTLSFEEMERWADSMPSDRENLMMVLETAKTLLRDLVIAKIMKDSSKLVHADLQKDIATFASKLKLSILLNRIEALHQTLLEISPIGGNANTRLALEAMMLRWAEG
jgi:DNA polymerase-3 subunit delta'